MASMERPRQKTKSAFQKTPAYAPEGLPKDIPAFCLAFFACSFPEPQKTTTSSCVQEVPLRPYSAGWWSALSEIHLNGSQTGGWGRPTAFPVGKTQLISSCSFVLLWDFTWCLFRFEGTCPVPVFILAHLSASPQGLSCLPGSQMEILCKQFTVSIFHVLATKARIKIQHLFV